MFTDKLLIQYQDCLESIKYLNKTMIQGTMSTLKLIVKSSIGEGCFTVFELKYTHYYLLHVVHLFRYIL